MCVSSSSRYQLTPSEHQFIYLTSIHFRLSSAQASKFGSHLHSSYISPPSKSLYPCVTSIQIMSHLHPSIHVSPPTRSRLNSIQAPVPLSIFRSNSKFDENSKHSNVTYTPPITKIFCTRHDSFTVVTCAKYRCDRWGIFKTRAFWIFIEFRIRSKYA